GHPQPTSIGVWRAVFALELRTSLLTSRELRTSLQGSKSLRSWKSLQASQCGDRDVEAHHAVFALHPARLELCRPTQLELQLDVIALFDHPGGYEQQVEVGQVE